MLELIDVTGTPAIQGEAHGRGAHDAVHHNIAAYARRFRDEALLSQAEVLERCEAYWARILDEAPAYAAGVQGIANGAGADLWDVVALNVRYEILYPRMTQLLLEGVSSGASECTAFAVDTRGGLVMGQNWDWIPEVRGVILRVREPVDTAGPNGSEPPPDVLCFTEAGIFGGKIGLNAHGIGLVVNGMISSGDDWRHVATPFHVRTWRALRSRTLTGAVTALTAGEHSCSANFVVGSSTDGAVDVETAPEGTRQWPLENGRLVHTNHFLAPSELGLREPPNPRRRFSVARKERFGALLEARDATIATLQHDLRDHDGHPNSVCRHPAPDEPNRPYQTVASAILDLDNGRMWATDGPPCQAEYQEFGLSCFDS